MGSHNTASATADGETTSKPAMASAEKQIKTCIGARETKALDQQMVGEPQW